MKTKTKRKTRTGAEPEKWRSYGRFSVGREGRRIGGREVEGIISVIGSHKIDGERLRIVQETKKPKNLYVQPMNMN